MRETKRLSLISLLIGITFRGRLFLQPQRPASPAGGSGRSPL
jgi:hypothetical protein